MLGFPVSDRHKLSNYLLIHWVRKNSLVQIDAFKDAPCSTNYLLPSDLFKILKCGLFMFNKALNLYTFLHFYI